MHQPVSTSDDQSVGNLTPWIVRLLNGFAYLFEAILHRNIGLRYAESSGFMGGLGLLGFLVFWSKFPVGPLCAFGAVFLVCHAMQRFRARARRRHGDHIHSYYCGDALLVALLPFLNDWQVKAWVEPVLLLAAGFLFGIWNEPLAALCWMGALSLFLTNHTTDQRQQARVYAMHDAMIENRVTAEQFRQWFGDGN